MIKNNNIHASDLANTSAGLDSRSRNLVSRSSLHVTKVGKEAGVGGASEIARVGESVDSTGAADVLLAGSSSTVIVDGEQATAGRGVLDRSLDTGEGVALGKDLGSVGDLKSVAGVVLPVVVDCVQQSVAGDLWGTAGGAVDVVTFEGDLILRTSEIQSPVLVAITGRGPVRGAVDLAIGDGDAAGGSLAENDVLTADLGGLGERVSLGLQAIEGLASYLDLVDPDHVGTSQRDSITTPDVLRVELSDVDVLDNDVRNTVCHPNSLALDDTVRARANDSLVGGNHDGVESSFVVRNRGRRRIGLVVPAPIVLVDGGLAASASAPRCTTRSGHGRTSEVECLAQQNDARARVSKVRDQFIVRGRGDDLSGLDDRGQLRS